MRAATRRRLRVVGLAAGALAALTAVVPARATVMPRTGGDAAEVLSAWLSAWRRGDIDLTNDRRYDQRSLVRRSRLFSGRIVGTVTPRRELTMLLQAAVDEGSTEATRAILQAAGADLDPSPAASGGFAPTVRQLGEAALRRLSSPEAVATVLAAARGEIDPRDGRALAMRVAALRALPVLRPDGAGSVLTSALGDADREIRVAAADAVRALGDPSTTHPVLQALACEPDDAVAMALLGALDGVLPASVGPVDARTRLAIDVALDQLCHQCWRRGLAALDFLERRRAVRTIPGLIAFLQAWNEKPPQERFGVVRHRAYDLLCSLTGNCLPIERPDRWLEFWQAERQRFVLPPPPRTDEGRTGTGFFGIPVTGSRVVFVLDVSGSMNDPYDQGATGGVTTRSKLQVAAEQLVRAVSRLDSDAEFNVVLFSARASRWNSGLRRASDEAKQIVTGFARRLIADGGTNLWAGLDGALDLHGEPADAHAGGPDEVFLLSDGAPTVGELTDPDTIVATLARANRFARVRINTVFLGPRVASDETAPAQELMRAIAEQNHGRFSRPR